MKQALLGKWTWIFLFCIFALAIGVPYLLGFVRVGAMSLGLPFVFYSSSSAPPPYGGSTTSWGLFAADVGIYYVLAALLAFAKGKLSKATA